MKPTPTIVLPKLFNWKKTTADEVLEKTYAADTMTVYCYKKNLKANYLDNKPVDIKLVRAMLAITDACKSNFGIALGMYMNEIEWTNYDNYANFKYTDTKATDPKQKQITDQVNNQIVTTFGNIVKNSFINAKGAEQHHMLRLVDEMVKYYCDEYFSCADYGDTEEIYDFSKGTLNAIERLQMKMQNHLQKGNNAAQANDLSPVATK